MQSKSRPRSEAEQLLRQIVNRASDAGLDSLGWPMVKIRAALLEKARMFLEHNCFNCGADIEDDRGCSYCAGRRGER
jgi:hypothetical protein